LRAKNILYSPIYQGTDFGAARAEVQFSLAGFSAVVPVCHE